jgi:hypothetical protein
LAATSWANALIDKVFPPICNIQPTIPSFAVLPPQLDMLELSRSIMQLPLSRGGLSLRLATSVDKIAYVASCIDCHTALCAAAAAIKVPFQLDTFGEYAKASAWLIRNVSGITPNTFVEATEVASLRNKNQTSQQLLTGLLNDSEIARIASTLAPIPSYFLSFVARTEKQQEHASWPFNPKIRATFSIGHLRDADFARGIQLATLRPAFSQTGWCHSCHQHIDTVGLHLLKCPMANYTGIHNAVKLALESKLRSLMAAQLASFSVFIEKPVIRFAPLCNPEVPEGTARIADIVLLLPGTCQQDLFIVDVVSTLCDSSNKHDGFYFDLNRTEAIKRNKYSKYEIHPHAFFPLAFSRTNVLSRETIRFCEMVDKYFPKSMRIHDHLRATISRAITAGVSASQNCAIRRLQLAEANICAFSMVPPISDHPTRRAVSARSRIIKSQAPLSNLSAAATGVRLASILVRTPVKEVVSGLPFVTAVGPVV